MTITVIFFTLNCQFSNESSIDALSSNHLERKGCWKGLRVLTVYFRRTYIRCRFSMTWWTLTRGVLRYFPFSRLGWSAGWYYLKTNGGTSSSVTADFFWGGLTLISFCFLKRRGTLNMPESKNIIMWYIVLIICRTT